MAQSIPDIKVSIDQGTGKVILHGSNGEIVDEKEVKTDPKIVDEASLKIALGFERKISDGNYGSAGFFVSLTAPTSIDDLEGDFEEVKAWVETKAGELTEAIVKSKLGG